MRTLFSALFVFPLAVGASDPAAPPGGVPSGVEFRVRTLLIPTGEPGVTLAGHLTIPSGDRRVPAVLLVTGSGPHTREQTISGCPSFRMISDFLTSRGFAVLNVDARGCGLSSGPDPLQTTTAQRTADAKACLEMLLRQPEIDSGRIGVIGHSEGAMIALMLAAQCDLARFVILLAPPGEPTATVWVEQRARGLAQRGTSPETVAAVKKEFTQFVQQAAAGFPNDQDYYEAGKRILRAHGLAENEVSDAKVDQIVSDQRTPWFRYFFGWRPETYASKIKQPLLAVWGEFDTQVPPARNAPLYERWSAESPNQVTVKVLPNDDHYFLQRPDRKPGTNHDYGRMHVSPALLGAMSEWMSQRAALAPR